MPHAHTSPPDAPSAKGLSALLGLQRAALAGAALAATLAAALALVPFFVVARMASAIYRTPPDLASVRTLALWAAGALLTRYVFVAAANMLAHLAAFRVLHTLRLQLAHKLGGVPLSFFSRHSAGELRKVLLDDVNSIEAFVAHNFPDAIAALIVPLATARIQAVLGAPELARTHGTLRPTHHGLSFRDVSFRYDDGHEVLQHVSFDAPAGQVTALVGPSGAGKTTLMRLVPRLWEASQGEVQLGGVDVKAMPLDTLLADVSMVFQDVFLFHGTVAENLRLARPDATQAQLEEACRAARADAFIQALPQRYDTLLGERGARLSGGERQRLSIARALLKDAPVLLLDEATAFADPENEARIQEALSDLCAGRTVLVVAHRPSSSTTM